MILLVDATVRRESRTLCLAEYLLAKLPGEKERIRLIVTPLPRTEEKLLALRGEAQRSGDFSAAEFAPARQFVRAEQLVIAAPYWDLSFPAQLKAYIEALCTLGLSFCYTADNRPQSLCRLKKVYYVTTAGGKILSREPGFGYVELVMKNFFGAEECVNIEAEELDLPGTDTEAVLKAAQTKIDHLCKPKM